MKKKYVVLLITVIALVLPSLKGNSQVIFRHVDNTSIYDFLDELANLKIIELNSAIKPYSRKMISQKLVEADSKSSELNKRQKKELVFFLKEYQKEIDRSNQSDFVTKKMFGANRVKIKDRQRRLDLFYYRDSLFMFTLNPILGAQFWHNDSGSVYHRWNGAEMMFTMGNRFGAYASLRDNYLSNDISGPNYLTQMTGGGFKGPTYGYTNKNAVEYSEMQGGITYNWKWGYVGILKDHNVWGNNYHGANIFSNRAPSFAQVRLNMQPVKWMEINYFHGWLSSKVIDTTATQNYGTGNSRVYVPKYMAANMITFKPVHNLYLSIGNSIIYSRDINVGYLIPVFFYKSLDHTYSSLGNSQLFVDLSTRNLKKCHFYVTAFFDDIAFGRMFKKDALNPWSVKVGGRVSDIISNVSLTAEYTRNDVLSYKHYNPETTFESTNYNFGNFLRDNAQDVFLQLTIKPVPKLLLSAAYNYSNKGPDYPDNRNQDDPVTGEPAILFLPFQSELIWEKTSYLFDAQYEIIHDLLFRMQLDFSDVKDKTGIYTPANLQGKQLTTSATLTFGF